MKYEYDNESDAMFIWFEMGNTSEEKKIFNEIWPKELKDHIGVLFDEEGKIMGIEVLFASNYFRLNNL